MVIINYIRLLADNNIMDDEYDFETANNKKIIYSDQESEPEINLPWVEKYRPQKLDEILDQIEIVRILKNTLKTGELPHMLFFGPPGTGKTSTILSVAFQLFGKDVEDRIIELNASDDRGIGIVRNKIITFAKQTVGSSENCPPFKIVILDEADSMTPEAQAALRDVIEKTAGITRFCFICNYINQIIEPIASRCMKIRFKPISKKIVANKLSDIAKNESICIAPECIQILVDISEGDLRKSIMILQNTKYIMLHKKTITPDDIIQISGGIDETKFKQIWNKCLSGNLSDMMNLTKYISREGYLVSNILQYFTKQLLVSYMSDICKSKIAIQISNCEKRLIEGGDEYLQILHILLFINAKNKL